MMSAGEQETTAAGGEVQEGSILDSMLSAMPKIVERNAAKKWSRT